MSNSTPITIIGNLTGDPELKFTPSGAAVCNFNVAVTERTFDKDTKEWKDGNTSYYRVNAWRSLAENIAESLTKGMRVIVTGSVQIRTYERSDGNGNGTSVDIKAEHVGPDLQFATAKITRASRSGGNNAGSQNGGDNPWGNQAAAQQPANDPWATPQPATQPTGGGNPWGSGSTADEPPF